MCPTPRGEAGRGSGSPGRRVGGIGEPLLTAGGSVGGDESILELQWRWSHNTANVLKATKLYGLKWVRWQMLCYMNFNMIRKTWCWITSCIFMNPEFQTRR